MKIPIIHKKHVRYLEERTLDTYGMETAIRKEVVDPNSPLSPVRHLLYGGEACVRIQIKAKDDGWVLRLRTRAPANRVRTLKPDAKGEIDADEFIRTVKFLTKLQRQERERVRQMHVEKRAGTDELWAAAKKLAKPTTVGGLSVVASGNVHLHLTEVPYDKALAFLESLA